MKMIALVILLVTPLAVMIWPPGVTPNRFIPAEDVCPSNQPTSLACVHWMHQDAALWHQGYAPRGYDPRKQPAIEPTQ